MGRLPRMNVRATGSRGMSLVEVLIAVVILVLVIIGLSRVITGSDAHTGRIGQVARAVRLVQQIIEECQSRPLLQYQSLFSRRADQTGSASCELDRTFFPNAETAVNAFRTEYEKSLQFFTCRVEAKPVFNSLAQIREIWLEAEIRWTEPRPESGTASAVPRVLRAGGLISNLEVR